MTPNLNPIAAEVRASLLERFLRYISIDTQSQEESDTYPSTSKQLDLLRLLHTELAELPLERLCLDEHGYVMAQIAPSPGLEDAPAIGFIAHVDTSPDLSGANVRPQIIESYTGSSIPLGESGYSLSPEAFPELEELIGHCLITTDGTTLLGADDKAGVAVIMTLATYLTKHPEVRHGRICIGFTPDEEVGRGVDHFDVEAFGARYAYTVDGSVEGELEYENFNAASAKLLLHGRNIHPGYAKGKMINALELWHELHAQLPQNERPEYTEGYEGFYHLIGLEGSVEEATASYIIRDHDRELFEQRKARLEHLVRAMNERYGFAVAELQLQDQYYNMREQIAPHPQLISLAEEAMRRSGVRPLIRPIRGGTDGARLSYMGLPCPNLFTGGANFHGRYEYASLEVMSRSVETLVHLVQLWGETTTTEP